MCMDKFAESMIIPDGSFFVVSDISLSKRTHTQQLIMILTKCCVCVGGASENMPGMLLPCLPADSMGSLLAYDVLSAGGEDDDHLAPPSSPGVSTFTPCGHTEPLLATSLASCPPADTEHGQSAPPPPHELPACRHGARSVCPSPMSCPPADTE